MPRLPWAVALVLMGCGAPKPPHSKGGRAAKVEVASVKEGRLQVRWRFTGDVRARARSSLAVGAAGAVLRVEAEVGQSVKQGALLIEVDRRVAVAQVLLAKAEIKEAEESLAQARREAERLRGLKRGIVAELEREQAQSRVSALEAALGARQAELQAASANLELHRIRAPFAGVVAARTVDLGDWVQPGDPALELVSTDRVDIYVNASPTVAGQIELGDTAQLLPPRGEPLALNVVGLVPALDPTSRTLTVRLQTVGQDAPLLPGQPVEVEFTGVVAREQAVVVPSDALLFDGNAYRVVREIDGKADFVPVQLLARSEGEALVRGEVTLKDRVVVRGNERVRPSQALAIVEGLP